MRLDGFHDLVQELVAGRMAKSVVDLLEVVDVDEGERELGARPPGALDFAGNFIEADLAGPGARQLVGRGELEGVLGLGGCTLASARWSLASLAVGGGPGAVFGGLGPVGSSSRAVILGPEQKVRSTRALIAVLVLKTSLPIASLGTAVAKLCRFVALVPGPQSLRRRLIALRCHFRLGREPSALAPTSSARERPHRSLAAKCVIGSVLILVRASLIALARGLVVVGPGLILIARGLIAIAECLVVGSAP